MTFSLSLSLSALNCQLTFTLVRRPVLLSTREEGKDARVEEVLWRGGADLEAPRFRLGPTLPTNATPAPGGLAPVADDATVLFRRPGRRKPFRGRKTRNAFRE